MLNLKSREMVVLFQRHAETWVYCCGSEEFSLYVHPDSLQSGWGEHRNTFQSLWNRHDVNWSSQRAIVEADWRQRGRRHRPRLTCWVIRAWSGRGSCNVGVKPAWAAFCWSAATTQEWTLTLVAQCCGFWCCSGRVEISPSLRWGSVRSPWNNAAHSFSFYFSPNREVSGSCCGCPLWTDGVSVSVCLWAHKGIKVVWTRHTCTRTPTCTRALHVTSVFSAISFLLICSQRSLQALCLPDWNMWDCMVFFFSLFYVGKYLLIFVFAGLQRADEQQLSQHGPSTSRFVLLWLLF